MKRIIVFCIIVAIMMSIANAAAATKDPTEILIKALVTKGIITESDADDIRAEIEAIKKEEEAKPKASPVINPTTKFPMNISGWIMQRYLHSSQNNVNDTFETSQARITFSGEPAKDIDYKLQMEFAGSRNAITSNTFATSSFSKPTVVDANIGWKMPNSAKLTVGQFLIPFSYDSLTSNTKIDFINRAIVVTELSPNRRNNQGRDIGIQYAGNIKINEGKQQFEYAMGIFNGANINSRDNNNAKDIALRAGVKSSQEYKKRNDSVQALGHVAAFPPWLTESIIFLLNLFA